VTSFSTPPLFEALGHSDRVLIAGAGGGFDVYAGLRLAIALWDRGVEAHLANLSFSQRSREAELYRAAVGYAQAATPMRPSIVNGQIAAASRGDFGDVQFTVRTRGSALFVNPLMAIYFSFELNPLAQRVLYLDRVENTVGMRQVATRIEEFRAGVTTRVPKAFPH